MKTSVSLACLAAVVISCMVATEVAAAPRAGCPIVPGQATLDVSKFLGKWYEYKRLPTIFEVDLECDTAHYSPASDKKIDVFNEGLVRRTVAGKKEVVRKETIHGNASVPDPSKPAELAVVFYPGQSTTKPNYFIQETNYLNYTVVFSCTDVLGIPIESAWILTRVRGQAPADLDRLEKNLASRGVDTNRFIVVDQQGCPSD